MDTADDMVDRRDIDWVPDGWDLDEVQENQHSMRRRSRFRTWWRRTSPKLVESFGHLQWLQ